MPDDFRSILPPNQNTYQRAIEQVVGQRLEAIDPAIIAQCRDPWQCPSALLPHLAFHRSVSLWREDWTDAFKRWVIANWPRLETERGTEAGLRNFAELAGATVRRVRTQPSKTFLGRNRTPEERARFLSIYPQLRTYPFVKGIQLDNGAFLYRGRRDAKMKRFLGRGIYPKTLGADQRYRFVTKLYDPLDGSEVELTKETIDTVNFEGEGVTYEQVTLPGRRIRKLFVGQARKKAFFGRNDNPSRIVTLRSTHRYSYTLERRAHHTVAPGLKSIDVTPELVTEVGPTRKNQFFPGRKSKRRFLSSKPISPSTAWLRIYERVYLFEPSRHPGGKATATTYVGRTYLGCEVATAHALVEIPTKRPKRAVKRYVRGFLMSGDRGKSEQVRVAVNTGRRLTDTVLLDTKTHRKLRAGDRIVPGVTKIGEIVRV